MRYNVNKDARGNVSVSTATRVGGTRRPRVHQKFSPVLITHADGSQSVITKTRKTRGIRVHTLVDIPHRTTAADLPAIFAD